MRTNTAAVFVILAIVAAAPLARAADPSPAASPASAGADKVVTTESGLQYVDTTVGTGPSPKVGQTVSIAYTISLGDRQIEKSRAGQPMQFAVGKDQALKGLDEGVRTMKVGGTRKLIVPPSLGYGAQALRNVPPNSTLVFDVELLDVK
jgi:peptidylprolyl isomerase